MSRHSTDDLGNVFSRHRRGIALTVVLLLVTLLAGTGLLGLSGHFLTSAALAGSVAVGFNLFGPSAGIRALTFVRILSRYAERLYGHQVTLAIARDLRVWFFRRALPLAPLGLGRWRAGDLLARLMADIDAVDGWLVRALGPMIALALLWTCGVAVAFVHVPALGLLLVIMLLSVVCAYRFAGSKLRAIETTRADRRAELRYALLEGIEGFTDLAALDATDAWTDRIALAQSRVSMSERRRKRWLNASMLLQNLVGALGVPAAAWVLFDAVTRTQTNAPTAAGLFFMAVAMLEVSAGFGLAWQAWAAARASSQRLRAVVDAPVTQERATDATSLPIHGELELDGVRLRWPDQPRDVLDGITLRVPQGRRIAIQGDSGAGKSSLLALLLKLRDPDAGQLRFAGHDLRDVDARTWHARLAWLPQDTPIFAGSVRDNLCMGDPDASDAQLWNVLARVHIDARVREWSAGLDGWVGANGATLSAGQARRLALARALLRDAPLLLLDEPTEGLDQDTADALMRDLVAAANDRSIVIITHAELPPGIVHETWRLQHGRLQRAGE